jgi:hypothetical protein
MLQHGLNPWQELVVQDGLLAILTLRVLATGAAFWIVEISVIIPVAFSPAHVVGGIRERVARR